MPTASEEYRQQSLAACNDALVSIARAQRQLEAIHPVVRETKPWQALQLLGKQLASVMADIGRMKL